MVISDEAKRPTRCQIVSIHIICALLKNFPAFKRLSWWWRDTSWKQIRNNPDRKKNWSIWYSGCWGKKERRLCIVLLLESCDFGQVVVVALPGPYLFLKNHAQFKSSRNGNIMWLAAFLTEKNAKYKNIGFSLEQFEIKCGITKWKLMQIMWFI